MGGLRAPLLQLTGSGPVCGWRRHATPLPRYLGRPPVVLAHCQAKWRESCCPIRRDGTCDTAGPQTEPLADSHARHTRPPRWWRPLRFSPFERPTRRTKPDDARWLATADAARFCRRRRARRRRPRGGCVPGRALACSPRPRRGARPTRRAGRVSDPPPRLCHPRAACLGPSQTTVGPPPPPPPRRPPPPAAVPAGPLLGLPLSPPTAHPPHQQPLHVRRRL